MRRPLVLAAVGFALVATMAVAWMVAEQRGGGGRAPSRGVPGYKPGIAAGVDVVLITIDTLRADALGFAGNRQAATPVLDALAARGRVFTDAHAHNVVTLPSHANILTGLYPYHHGVRENSGFVMNPRIPTLATQLGAAGYSTGAFVAAYPLDSRFGLDRGFGVYDDSYPKGSNPDSYEMLQRRGDRVVSAALDWWRKQTGKKRFLWLHLYDPHAPYLPPEPYAKRFRGQPKDLYAGEVAATDAFLAPLLEPMLAGKEKPALVVMTSDHGESLGAHGELTHGLFAYEETLKVPLVVWGKGVAAGLDARPARHIDIASTVLEALGLPKLAASPGRSLLAPEVPGESSYFEALSTNLNRGWAPLRGVLADRKKLIELPLGELYDLDRDPHEQKNLLSTRAELASSLRKRIAKESVWPPQRTAEASSEEIAQLRSLGYAASSAAPKASYGPEDDPKRLLTLDLKLQEVVEAYTRGDYERSVRLAREVAIARPSMAEPYEHMALSLRQLERPTEAITALRSAIGRGADRESVRRQLALALAEIGQGVDALEALAPVIDSDDIATQKTLGLAYAAAGRYREAIATFEKAQRSDPGDPKLLENLGIVKLRMNRPAEARDLLRKAVAANANLPVSWNTLGVALYQTKDVAGALDAWERAASLDPRQYDALFNLGLVAFEAGDRERAKSALRRFVATAPLERFAADLDKARRLLERLEG